MLEQTIERWFDEATMKGVRQGIQQGLEQGLERGLHQGFAKLVAPQLQPRFGSVPGWVQDCLRTASEEQLAGWAGAILTATSLADIFGTDGPVH